MGGAPSRPTTIIDYVDAVSRLGQREVDAIQEGFNRIATTGSLGRLDWTTSFLSSFVGPMPEALATALFRGFDVDASGDLSKKEFICGLAVLRKGTPEEKIRLLFNAYDLDRDQRIENIDLANFARALNASRGETVERAIEDAIETLRAGGRSVNYERFEQWAKGNIDSPLVAWIFDVSTGIAKRLSDKDMSDDIMGSDSKMVPLSRTISAANRQDATELEELCLVCAQTCGSSTSHFDRTVVEELRAAWRLAAEESKFGVVDFTTFQTQLPSAPKELLERLFRVYDVSGSGTITLREWCRGFITCMHGDADARRRLCFRLFAEGVASVDGQTELGIPAAAAETLQRFAGLSVSIFAERSHFSPRVQRPCTVNEDLVLRDLDREPWTSEAIDLMRSLGQLACIDLKIRPREPREEREIVDRLNAKFNPDKPGQRGDSWCLVSAKWYESWCEFTGAQTSDIRSPRLGWQRAMSRCPSSIDNSDLVDQAGGLRIGLCHRVDYEVVTSDAWRALHAWYGGEGPALQRQVIEIEGHTELEMYPLRLRVQRTNDKGDILLDQRLLVASRASLWKEVCESGCGVYNMKQQVQVFHRSSENEDWQESDGTAMLHTLGFIDGHSILLQLSKHSSPQSPTSPKPAIREHQVVGLQNLGNTCYMNASAQCLIHTPMFKEYFIEEYLYDVNTKSKWGMAGKLAVAFAELVQDIAHARRKGAAFVAPAAFKRTIGDFHADFAGWRQQDAQEFLSIFLAGLSEDLNRVQTKPYVELKDSEGRPDHEVAAEFWSAHCQRELSVISALFSGQLKSVIRCLDCGHENARFDVFSFLPVALPEHDFRWVTCTVQSSARAGVGRHTEQVCARVPKRGRVADLLHAVGGIVGLNEAELVAADIASHYIFRVYELEHQLTTLGEDSRPTIFHVCPQDRLEAPSDDSDSVLVFFVHRRLRKVERYFRNPYKQELFSTPGLLRFTARCSSTELFSAVWQLVKHCAPDFDPGPDKRWPFSLRRVSGDGITCSRCSWRKGCFGCAIPTPSSDSDDCNATTHAALGLRAGETIGIDWHADVLQDHYKPKLASRVDIHETVGLAQIERDAPEKLTQCLDCLVKPEELHMYCRECTKKNDGDFTETMHSKTMHLWGCPPFLILQLKRFLVKGGVSYKLHNLIQFPMRLDLRDYLSDESCADGLPSAAEERDSDNNDAPPKAPVLKTLSRDNTEYRLYAVVNHFGGITSGHYNSYVRDNDRWLCCDDHRVYAVSEETVVSSNAYLLFYERLGAPARTAILSQSMAGLGNLFPQREPDSTAVNQQEIKKKRWIRSVSRDGRVDTLADANSNGFCGLM